MRSLGVPLLLLVLAVLGPAASAQRRATPPVQRVSLGPLEVEMFGSGEPQRSPYGQGERVWLSFEGVTQTLMRGPTTWLTSVAPSARRAPFGVLDRPARACDVSATRRERVERWSEITSMLEDGSGEVARAPGEAEITLAFEHAGSHWALAWTLADRRHRARHRALERRFFASLRCAPRAASE